MSSTTPRLPSPVVQLLDAEVRQLEGEAELADGSRKLLLLRLAGYIYSTARRYECDERGAGPTGPDTHPERTETDER